MELHVQKEKRERKGTSHQSEQLHSRVSVDFTAFDIIHFWADSRGKLIHIVYPSKGKIFVCCTVDLSEEAVKVCRFITLVVKRSWTFQRQHKDELFELTFFPETVSLGNLFNSLYI